VSEIEIERAMGKSGESPRKAQRSGLVIITNTGHWSGTLLLFLVAPRHSLLGRFVFAGCQEPETFIWPTQQRKSNAFSQPSYDRILSSPATDRLAIIMLH
jgi:hypothetical protein